KRLNLATLLPVSSARKPLFEAHLCRPFVFPTTSLTPSCSRLDRFALTTAMPFCRRSPTRLLAAARSVPAPWPWLLARPRPSFTRGGKIQTGVKSPTDFAMLTPTYVFATPVLGGQASVGMSALYGRNATSVSATLTGPGGASLSGSNSDYVLGFGDLYPAASLKWNLNEHDFMVYATTGIPVGVYDPTRLASLGLGHWAADAGAGYTYLNEQIGFEWSAVAGLTYNFINPYTQYQSGIDAHLDWAISPYLTD